MTSVAILAIVLALMALEARRSRAHARALVARGAVEPPGDVYAIMQVVYPASFLVMAVEGWLRGAGVGPWFWLGAGVLAAGKAIKYWAMATLGPLWSFRLLVVPGQPLVTRGPYRFLRHPNYAGVAGELVGVALMTMALVTGTFAVLGFGVIMFRRIVVEERALGLR